jgi:hypothetical protein
MPILPIWFFMNCKAEFKVMKSIINSEQVTHLPSRLWFVDGIWMDGYPDKEKFIQHQGTTSL